MERTLILQTTQGETVTEAEVCCFARQLLKDLKSDAQKIKWTREANAPWGTFVSTGLYGTSIIYPLLNKVFDCALQHIFIYPIAVAMTKKGTNHTFHPLLFAIYRNYSTHSQKLRYIPHDLS